MEEKIISKELRDKIIQLIHKELNDVGHDSIFNGIGGSNYCVKHNNNNNSPWIKIVPITSFYTTLNSNIDTKNSTLLINMAYTLLFADGEPSISISTIHEHTEHKEYYKTIRKWFKKEKCYTTHFKHSTTTVITCGHLKFKLKDEEQKILIEKTQTAYDKYLLLKAERRDSDVLTKINQRLNPVTE